MSRYIDADAVENTLQQIETITAMSNIELGEEDDDIGEISIPIFTVRNIINTAPSIDIVRCRECKWSKANGTYQWCGRLDSTAKITDDDFCSYGQKGDENVETD